MSEPTRAKVPALALVKEREKGSKGGSTRPKSGVDTTGRRSTMGQAGDKRRSEDPNNCKSAAHLDWQQAKRLHEKKNFEAEKKKLAKRAALQLAASLITQEEEDEEHEQEDKGKDQRSEAAESNDNSNNNSDSCFALQALSRGKEDVIVTSPSSATAAATETANGVSSGQEVVEGLSIIGGDGGEETATLSLKEQKAIRKANIKRLLAKSFAVLG